MRRQLVPAIISMVIFTVLLGLVYPLVVTGVAQVAFKDKADGSIVEHDGKQGRLEPHRAGVHERQGRTDQEVLPGPSVGGELRPHVQHRLEPRPDQPEADRQVPPRPEDDKDGNGRRREGNPVYETNADGPRSATRTRCRSAPRRTASSTGSRSTVKIPVDAVTASGSGLDPDISVANAKLQAQPRRRCPWTLQGPGAEGDRRPHRRSSARHPRREDRQRARPQPRTRQVAAVRSAAACSYDERVVVRNRAG